MRAVRVAAQVQVVSALSAPPRLALHGISKRYGNLLANDRIDLTVAAGEIHALLGENGAGKSTLMKVVYGVTPPDAGRIEWEGRAVAIRSPAQARRLGIGMVFQHFSLFETLTVAENISLALDERLPAATLAARISAVSQRYGLPIDPQRLVHSMSVGERQRVEIVRCLLQAPRLLILDEPTSVLTPQAVRALFETLRRLAAEGVSILYISHKLDEIRELCDVATVLRDGRVVGRAFPHAETSESLARMMVGGELRQCRLEPREPGPIQLELTDLSLGDRRPFRHTPLQPDQSAGTRRRDRRHCRRVRQRPEGAAGGDLRRAARYSTRRATAVRPGRRAPESGAAPPAGIALRARGAARARCGARHAPGRQLRAHRRDRRAGAPRPGSGRAARAFARATIAQFAVKCDGEQALAESLSGGNLQKFIVGREIRLAAHGDAGGAADLGGRRRRLADDPSGADRAARRRGRAAGDLRGTR